MERRNTPGFPSEKGRKPSPRLVSPRRRRPWEWISRALIEFVSSSCALKGRLDNLRNHFPWMIILASIEFSCDLNVVSKGSRDQGKKLDSGKYRVVEFQQSQNRKRNENWKIGIRIERVEFLCSEYIRVRDWGNIIVLQNIKLLIYCKISFGKKYDRKIDWNQNLQTC